MVDFRWIWIVVMVVIVKLRSQILNPFFRFLLHSKKVVRMSTKSLLARGMFNCRHYLVGGNGANAHHGVTEVRANLKNIHDYFF